MWAEWTAYVACSVVYVLLLRGLTIFGVYEMNCTMYILGVELCKLLIALGIYLTVPDARAGRSAADKCRSLALHWKEGFRFASVGMAFAVHSAALVLDVARMRPPLHRVIVAMRPLVTAAVLQYTNGGRVAWDARQWSGIGLLASAGMVLPLYDWLAGESVYDAFAVALVGLAEVIMFSGANTFLEHLFSKRIASSEQPAAESLMPRQATDWQQAVYLTASSSFVALLIFEAATPVKMDRLYLYWFTTSWMPYAAILVGGCAGIAQIRLMRAGGCMAKELALTSVVPLSAMLIQLSGSLEPIQEISMIPIAAALLLTALAAVAFQSLQPLSAVRGVRQ